MIHNFIPMIIISIISGMLSTMNVWVDKFSDISWSLNDIYMSVLMTGWMFLLMGIYNNDIKIGIFGLIVVLIFLMLIRNQTFINKSQYISGMIPHHSMAVYMSRKLLKNDPLMDKSMNDFVNNIINTQNKEIEFMKQKVF